MNRAERRRQEKAAKKKVPTYNLTKTMLDEAVRSEADRQLKEAFQEGFDKGTNQALILMLSIPLMVLKDHFWKKSFRQRIPKFMEEVFKLYEAWQDDEIDINDLRQELWEIGGIRLEESERE